MAKVGEKTYLGDGVYARFTGYDIELTTENGISVTNRIHLENDVLIAFERFVASIRQPHSNDLAARTSDTSSSPQEPK